MVLLVWLFGTAPFFKWFLVSTSDDFDNDYYFKL